ncbi:MAG: DUF4494 domain-containing protein [Paludibacteraceae bacterium]|nr:DUF4494 domain-containing protein [Paludibacteraceae bacterium]
MANWFECKVKFEKISEQDGSRVMSSEIYVVDAINFTNAEERVLKEALPMAQGEVNVDTIKHVKIVEIFPSFNGEVNLWYRCKVNYLIPDEEKGTIKRTAQTWLVQADDFKQAVDTLQQQISKSLADIEIVQVSQTNILDVLQYQPEEKTEPQA